MPGPGQQAELFSMTLADTGQPDPFEWFVWVAVVMLAVAIVMRG